MHAASQASEVYRANQYHKLSNNCPQCLLEHGLRTLLASIKSQQ